MSDHRDALARTIIKKWRTSNPRSLSDDAEQAIDALRAEGWSIVKLRPARWDSSLYVITEGEK